MSLSLRQRWRQTHDAARILERIQGCLREEFRLVSRHIEAAMATETRLTREVGDYLREAKSKRLRAAMHLFAARACGYQGQSHTRVAAAIELIHLATLLHDDVIDRADSRRGRPSVNAKWNNSIAILMADFLYSRGYSLFVEELDPRGTALIAESTAFMCEGEMFQLQKERDILTPDDYYHVIEAKTANLFSVAMKLGGILAGAGDDTLQRLGEFGRCFGMAFQITDDTLDYVAESGQWGKGIGADVACGKQTLPLIHALQVADRKDRDFLTAQLELGGSSQPEGATLDTRAVIETVLRYDAIEYSRRIAADFARRAAESIHPLPASKDRDFLLDLANYVVNRDY
ncbi:polyprenyl synthetase family protein [Candidatus Sumerlaeota bacterium]|nr:polyprenyl synthetase family protein [Candidatus Sumerlaeota bacterium]